MVNIFCVNDIGGIGMEKSFFGGKLSADDITDAFVKAVSMAI